MCWKEISTTREQSLHGSRMDMELIQSPAETEELCRKAEADDSLYFVPAFTGLGAPYWNSEAKGALIGITRTTRKAEMVCAGVECIAYQIADVVNAMSQDAKPRFRSYEWTVVRTRISI